MSSTRIDYCYADPAGNITILAETSFLVSDYPEIASRLLSAEPAAEQVGFIERVTRSGVSMRMAGGEFCGNAAFSAAALAADRSDADEGIFTVDFYGIDHPLPASIKRISGHAFTGRIEMPQPEELSRKRLCFEGTEMLLPVVRLPGIAHIICTGPLDRAFAEAALKRWCVELEAPAAGIMLLDVSRAARLCARSRNAFLGKLMCQRDLCGSCMALIRNGDLRYLQLHGARRNARCGNRQGFRQPDRFRDTLVQIS